VRLNDFAKGLAENEEILRPTKKKRGAGGEMIRSREHGPVTREGCQKISKDGEKR